jgi:hypothetical protein
MKFLEEREGFCDHIASPYKDYDGVGFSPQRLSFAEDLYCLAPLPPPTSAQKSPAKDRFDFSQNPRTFVRIKAPYPPNVFHRPSHRTGICPGL